jgi:hypothetical protein
LPPDLDVARKVVGREIDRLTKGIARGWSPTDEAKEAARRLEKPLDEMIRAL